MVPRVLLISIIIATVIHALELKPAYIFTDHNITSQTLFPQIDQKFSVIRVPEHKTRIKVPVAKISTKFASKGFKLDTAGMRRITFIKKSPIDTSVMETKIAAKYQKRYQGIDIKALLVVPRSYTEKLPATYQMELNPKSMEQSDGTFYIRTPDNRKIFFDYFIDANVNVLHAKQDIGQNTELTAFNTFAKTITFNELKGTPITTLTSNPYRTKYKIRANTMIDMSDLEPSPLVKKGQNIHVSMKTGLVLIEFAAVALEDGGLHDIISIRKTDGQKIKAKVTGSNRVEIQ